jgi:hypothetical protein
LCKQPGLLTVLGSGRVTGLEGKARGLGHAEGRQNSNRPEGQDEDGAPRDP